jgi:hypothetical protein
MFMHIVFVFNISQYYNYYYLLSDNLFQCTINNKKAIFVIFQIQIETPILKK